MVFPFEMLIWKCKMFKRHRIFHKQMTDGIHWIATPASIIPRINQSPSSICVLFFFPLPWLPHGRGKWRDLRSPKPNKSNHSHGTQIFLFINKPKTLELDLHKPLSSHISQGLLVWILLIRLPHLIETTKSTKFKKKSFGWNVTVVSNLNSFAAKSREKSQMYVLRYCWWEGIWLINQPPLKGSGDQHLECKILKILFLPQSWKWKWVHPNQFFI